MPEISMGAAQTFIEGEFGGPTEEKEYEKTITTAATEIVGNDPEALALTLINLGTNTAYIFYDNTLSTAKAIILNASGGFVSLTVRDDQTLPTRQWWGLTSTGTTQIVAIRTRRYALTYQESKASIAARLAAMVVPKPKK